MREGGRERGDKYLSRQRRRGGREERKEREKRERR